MTTRSSLSLPTPPRGELPVITCTHVAFQLSKFAMCIRVHVHVHVRSLTQMHTYTHSTFGFSQRSTSTPNTRLWLLTGHTCMLYTHNTFPCRLSTLSLPQTIAYEKYIMITQRKLWKHTVSPLLHKAAVGSTKSILGSIYSNYSRPCIYSLAADPGDRRPLPPPGRCPPPLGCRPPYTTHSQWLLVAGDGGLDHW